METGFCKGQSDNLPKVSTLMMCDFFATNRDFISSETRGVKTLRSCREDYGDNAVGYVQVKREGMKCTVKARITPEHKVKSKPYHVCFICDEQEEEVKVCICEDCPASQGGCKHAVAFLSWLHRRSEEPSKTSVQCYWKKSKMADIGTAIKFIKGEELGKPLPVKNDNCNKNFLADFIAIARSKNLANTVLTSYFIDSDELVNVSIHRLKKAFMNSGRGKMAEDFLNFMKMFLTDNICEHVRRSTIQQSKSNLWHELRYGRITASRFYEATKCSTVEGSLVEYILGAKIPETEAIKRGQILEHIVFDHIKKTFPDIKKCGLIISKDHPILGASPDGINDQFIFEIKCPTTKKWETLYFRNSQPAPRFAAQMQLQMHLGRRSKGLFVVANPDYEINQQLSICQVDYDQEYCESLIQLAEAFWVANIFHKL